MSDDTEILQKRLADLLRNKRRAKRRGDYNYDSINAEYKAVKAELLELENEA